MEAQKITCEGVTFDDVLLLPRRSDFLPGETAVATQLTQPLSNLHSTIVPRLRLNLQVLRGAPPLQKPPHWTDRFLHSRLPPLQRKNIFLVISPHLLSQHLEVELALCKRSYKPLRQIRI